MTDAAELKAALDEAEAELQAVYRKVWPLREAYAEAVPPAALPSRRNRTDKQTLIARCPRCGGRLEDMSRDEYHAEVQKLKEELKEARSASHDS